MARLRPGGIRWLRLKEGQSSQQERSLRKNNPNQQDKRGRHKQERHGGPASGKLTGKEE